MKTHAIFNVTSVVWHEVSQKIMLAGNSIEKELNDNLVLSKYGNNAIELVFIFLALQSYIGIHEEYQSYQKKKKRINLHLKLDYSKIAEAYDAIESLPLMAALFLDSIPKYYPTLNIPDFDWQRFALDVKLLFIRKNWLDRMLTIDEKIALTQLSKEIIELIETQPNEALVGDVMAYCKGLKLNIEEVVPDLLGIKEHLIT